jgi:hypothetical protein
MYAQKLLVKEEWEWDLSVRQLACLDPLMMGLVPENGTRASLTSNPAYRHHTMSPHGERKPHAVSLVANVKETPVLGTFKRLEISISN